MPYILLALTIAVAIAGIVLWFLSAPSLSARQKWAAQRGYEFAKQDEYLVDEFTRGAAAGGARPSNVVSGQVLGHEMIVMDLHTVPVMAMRTGAASDVVLDLRRDGAENAAEPDAHSTSPDPAESDDLLMALDVAGFTLYASDIHVAERFVDSRVRTALAAMPDVVEAVWCEGEWVLAQLSRARGIDAELDALQAPLALLADAARTLPPRSSAAPALRLEDGDPSRLMEHEAVSLASGPVLVADVEESFVHPPIQRPEEPVDLPSRHRPASLGAVDKTALGADEVEAIADGRERPRPDSTSARLPRLPRNGKGGSSIFDGETGPLD